jgi:hypothetical protein
MSYWISTGIWPAVIISEKSSFDPSATDANGDSFVTAMDPDYVCPALINMGKSYVADKDFLETQFYLAGITNIYVRKQAKRAPTRMDDVD